MLREGRQLRALSRAHIPQQRKKCSCCFLDLCMQRETTKASCSREASYVDIIQVFVTPSPSLPAYCWASFPPPMDTSLHTKVEMPATAWQFLVLLGSSRSKAVISPCATKPELFCTLHRLQPWLSPLPGATWREGITQELECCDTMEYKRNSYRNGTGREAVFPNTLRYRFLSWKTLCHVLIQHKVQGAAVALRLVGSTTICSFPLLFA